MSTLNRYSAHINVEELGAKGQQLLFKAKILVVGAGGLGCPVIQYLAASGVGTFGIMDYDKVQLDNLPRQILFTEKDLDRNKAEAIVDKLNAANTKLISLPERLDRKNAIEILSKYDLVLDCTDDPETRYVISDAAVLNNIPVVYAGVYKFNTQIAVLNYKGGPTYRCLFPEPPNNLSGFKCSDAGILSTVTGIAGLYQAHEAIKVITNMPDILNGKMMVLDLKNMSQKIMLFKRNRMAEQLAQEKFNHQGLEVQT